MNRAMAKSVAAWEDDGGARCGFQVAPTVTTRDQETTRVKPGDCLPCWQVAENGRIEPGFGMLGWPGGTQ